MERVLFKIIHLYKKMCYYVYSLKCKIIIERKIKILTKTVNSNVLKLKTILESKKQLIIIPPLYSRKYCRERIDKFLQYYVASGSAIYSTEFLQFNANDCLLVNFKNIFQE